MMSAFLVRLVGLPPSASAIVASSARSLRSRPSTSIESRLTVVMSSCSCSGVDRGCAGWIGTPTLRGFDPGIDRAPASGGSGEPSESDSLPRLAPHDGDRTRRRRGLCGERQLPAGRTGTSDRTVGSGSAAPQPPPVRHPKPYPPASSGSNHLGPRRDDFSAPSNSLDRARPAGLARPETISPPSQRARSDGRGARVRGPPVRRQRRPRCTPLRHHRPHCRPTGRAPDQGCGCADRAASRDQAA